MLIYRAIEFSRFSFLINEYYKNLWSELSTTENSTDGRYTNWWLKNDNINERRKVIRNVIEKDSEFFTKSFDFNSKIGGRYNPPKSFGSIYCSTCPTVASLEVLYHVFESSFNLYKDLKKSSDKLTTSFNIPVPDQIEVMIVSLEMEIKDTDKFFRLCETRNKYIEVCKMLGFGRYIDRDFNEDFIFGNNYEVTNIIGCHLHAEGQKILYVPSARLEIEFHNKYKKTNLIIPETMMEQLKPHLTGKFREYTFKLSMIEEKGMHKIDIEAEGSTSEKATLYLESPPNRRNQRIIEFSQIDDTSPDKRKYSREVRLQKFVKPHVH